MHARIQILEPFRPGSELADSAAARSASVAVARLRVAASGPAVVGWLLLLHLGFLRPPALLEHLGQRSLAVPLKLCRWTGIKSLLEA